MDPPDIQMLCAVNQGEVVLYEGTPHYTGANYYPDYLHITAEGYKASGLIGLRLSENIYSQPLVNP